MICKEFVQLVSIEDMEFIKTGIDAYIIGMQ